MVAGGGVEPPYLAYEASEFTESLPYVIQLHIPYGYYTTRRKRPSILAAPKVLVLMDSLVETVNNLSLMKQCEVRTRCVVDSEVVEQPVDSVLNVSVVVQQTFVLSLNKLKVCCLAELVIRNRNVANLAVNLVVQGVSRNKHNQPRVKAQSLCVAAVVVSSLPKQMVSILYRRVEWTLVLGLLNTFFEFSFLRHITHPFRDR